MYLYLTNPVIGGLTSSDPGEFFGNLFSTLMTAGFMIGLTYFVFMFIKGCIMWITAGGDKGQLQSARSTLIFSLIGLVILLGIVGIIDFVERFLGIKITNFNLDRLKVQP